MGGIRRVAGAAVATIALVLAAAPAADAYSGFLHRDHTRIVDGQGQVVRLKGLNLGNWLQWEGFLMCSQDKFSPLGQTGLLRNLATLVGQARADQFRADVEATYTTQADFQRIAALGYNVVRLAFNHDILEDDAAPGVYKASGWALLDRAIGWAEASGLYVVLDLHAAPGGQNALQLSDPDPVNLWNSETDKARTAALWAAIAARYRDRVSIAGYDLLNEPIPPNSAALLSLYDRIGRAIRAVDPNHMLMLEGENYATHFGLFTTRQDENMALTFHQYLWSWPDPEPRLADAEGASTRLDVPLWNGEFGNDSYRNIARQVDRYNPDPAINGWADWLWKGCVQGNGHRSAHDFTPTAAWSKTITWMSNTSRPKPTPAEAEQGMQDYVRISSGAPEDRMTIDALALQTPTPAPVGTGTGLTGTYYGDATFAVQRLVRTDPTINFNWYYGAPATGLPTNRFTARWTGSIQPRWSETYQFTVTADDAIRLYIDGTLVIDDWSGRGRRVTTGRIPLVAGQRHAIRLDYYEDTLGAQVKLEWESARQDKQVVPATQLYPQ